MSPPQQSPWHDARMERNPIPAKTDGVNSSPENEHEDLSAREYSESHSLHDTCVPAGVDCSQAQKAVHPQGATTSLLEANPRLDRWINRFPNPDPVKNSQKTGHSLKLNRGQSLARNDRHRRENRWNA